jgi:hypothetical protein
MTNQQHPITPPPDLVEQWEADWHCSGNTNGNGFTYFVAARAAAWGSDQELEACCEWLNARIGGIYPRDLRAARRPKPQNAPMTDFRALCTELLCSLEQYPVQPPRDRNLIDRVRAALAEPEEQRPTDEELVELFNDNDWNYISPETFLNIARSVLELR